MPILRRPPLKGLHQPTNILLHFDLIHRQRLDILRHVTANGRLMFLIPSLRSSPMRTVTDVGRFRRLSEEYELSMRRSAFQIAMCLGSFFQCIRLANRQS